MSSSGVLVKHIDFPDPSAPDIDKKRSAWFRQAVEQLALLDIERFAVTHAVSTPTAVRRHNRKPAKKK